MFNNCKTWRCRIGELVPTRWLLEGKSSTSQVTAAWLLRVHGQREPVPGHPSSPPSPAMESRSRGEALRTAAPIQPWLVPPPLTEDAACRRELPCSQALWCLFWFAACKSSVNTRDVFHSIGHGKPGLIFSQLLASYLFGIKIEWSEWKKKRPKQSKTNLSLAAVSSFLTAMKVEDGGQMQSGDIIRGPGSRRAAGTAIMGSSAWPQLPPGCQTQTINPIFHFFLSWGAS